MIQDTLFTNWKFGLAFDTRRHDLQLLVLELFYFVLYRIIVLYGELMPSSSLNKPPVSIKHPPNV